LTYVQFQSETSDIVPVFKGYFFQSHYNVTLTSGTSFFRVELLSINLISSVIDQKISFEGKAKGYGFIKGRSIQSRYGVL